MKIVIAMLIAQLTTTCSLPWVLGAGLFETLIPALGMLLCALAVFQAGLWVRQSFLESTHNEKQFKLSRELLRRQIDTALTKYNPPKSEDAIENGDWQGFRKFRIVNMEKETQLCTSVYLQPEDGKPIVGFRPGQHLTFKFQIPGQAKPVVRCYSLSDSPDKNYYRISVKICPPPRDKPDLPSGRASTFVNRSLMVGDVLQVKSPSGHFYLDEQSEAPVVMLAGGIGITPMMSMIEHIIKTKTKRLAVLVYGSRNGEDHAFKARINEIANAHSNIYVVNVYSSPLGNDQEGVDYHQAGFVSLDLIQKLLPHNKCQFYMCGPPMFMESVYNGLIDWQVPESRINFEAFGPASIGKTKNKKSSDTPAEDTGAEVTFAKSNKKIGWNSNVESILELAEENDITIDSGCRAGSCGTCMVEVLKGKVKYPEGTSPDCPAGNCLACIARPDGPLELEV